MRNLLLGLTGKNAGALLLLWGLGMMPLLMAQAPISEVKMKDFYVDEEVFPYEWLGREQKHLGWLYRPAVRLSENEFVYLWKPRFEGSTTRRLTCFNLLLEQQWETEIKLSYKEDEFFLFHQDSLIVVLIHQYDAGGKTHIVRAETYGRKSGKQVGQHLLMTLPGSSYQVMGIDFSPDEQQFVLYSCGEGTPNRQVRTFYDHLRSDQSFGYRVTNLGRVDFATFGRSLEKLSEGQLQLNLTSKSKRYLFDVQLDNGGNVYASAYGKNTGLEVFQYRSSDGLTRALRYPDYPDPWFKHFPYQAHVPPRVGEDMKVYAAHSMRKKFHGRWRTQGFRIATFDFAQEQAGISHEVEISAAFLVQINKAREDAGRKPDPIFDKYVIQEILPLGGQGLWLVTQRYEEGRSLQEEIGYAHPSVFSSLAEEMIFYEFEPDGSAHKAIIVPMRQQARSMWGEISRVPHIEVDQEEGCIHLLTREYHGDRSQRPPRIFYRKIDLESGTYGPRMQIFDGRQRDQYFIPPFTVWLNPQLVALLVIDGSGRRNPEVVTLKVND